MKKQASTVALFTAILIVTVAGAIIGFAQADPFLVPYPRFQGFVQPKPDTKPPEILISSPLNGSTYTGAVYVQPNYFGSVELNLRVSPPTGPTVITGAYTGPTIVEIYYLSSWNQTKNIIYSNPEYINHHFSLTIPDFSGNVTVMEVPHGWQNITVYAEYLGMYNPYIGNTYAKFYITGSSSVSFFMDAAPPSVTVLSPLNQTYTTENVPLKIHVDSTTWSLSYSLNGAEKTLISGNTTLSGFPPGTHNVTVYARDTLKREGTSETIIFTVSEPAPFSVAVLAATGSGVAATVSILVGSLLIFKKRKRKLNPPQAK